MLKERLNVKQAELFTFKGETRNTLTEVKDRLRAVEALAQDTARRVEALEQDTARRVEALEAKGQSGK